MLRFKELISGPPKLWTQVGNVFLLVWIPCALTIWWIERHPRAIPWPFLAFVISLGSWVLPAMGVIMFLQWRFARRLAQAVREGGGICEKCDHTIGHESQETTVCPECGHPKENSLRWNEWQPAWKVLCRYLRGLMDRRCKRRARV